MKKFRLLAIIVLLALILVACGEKSYNISEDRNIELGTIDGSPCYYDPMYYFKVYDGIIESENIDLESFKWGILACEVCIMEVKSLGFEVSQQDIVEEIENRHEAYENTPDRIANYQKALDANEFTSRQDRQNLIDQISVEQRIYEKKKQLIEDCMAGDGLTEEEFWLSLEPYVEKSFYLYHYLDILYEDYDKAVKEDGNLSYSDFGEKRLLDLFDAHNVEYVMNGEPDFSLIFGNATDSN